MPKCRGGKKCQNVGAEKNANMWDLEKLTKWVSVIIKIPYLCN